MNNLEIIQVKNTVKGLVETIDDNQYNDFKIILEDGEISASKLVLMSSSEYFQVMLNSSYQEVNKNSVKLPYRKKPMMSILKFLYCGKFDTSTLNALEMIEVLDIARYLLLKGLELVLEENIRKMFKRNYVNISETLEALEKTYLSQMHNVTKTIMFSLIPKLEVIIENHKPSIQCWTKDVFLGLFRILLNVSGNNEEQVLLRLKLLGVWYNTNKSSLSSEELRNIRNCFNLTRFSVRQLLHDVMDSKIFPLEVIKEAVEVVHNKVLEERDSYGCFIRMKNMMF